MHSVHHDDLIIADNRQRREFEPEALTDLANSITQLGLLHPIVVRETSLGLVLVAGERRLRALETIWLLGDGIRCNGAQFDPYEVPYITLGELDPLEAEEAELDENIKRTDLTWQEESAALARLNALRIAQAEQRGEEHTIADTLREVGVPPGLSSQTARQKILLADHLDKPEVAKARTVGDAFKIIKREEERKRNEQLAAKVGETYNSTSHSLHNVNCLDYLRTCTDRFDCILTDPPYGIDADQFGDAAGRLTGTTHEYDDSLESWFSLMKEFAALSFTVAKDQAHCYIFCDFDRFADLRTLMREAGWYVFRTPLVVYKQGSGRVPLPENGPRRQYELCLYAIKGWKPVTGIYSDVIPCRLEENLAHGANKPVELFVDLLRRSTRPGDSVLDAFAGTGTIFPAAHSLKLYATGLEINPEYYGIATERLSALDEEPKAA